MNNSVKEIIAFLTACPFSSENEILLWAFGYKRSDSQLESNKKYAEMIRRGMRNGLIARVEAKVAGKRDKFFYFIPKKVN